tara:strand:- start:334 stop:453 length:120 start_codon:yes stop_codon:yes gene_type:complete
MEQTNFAIFERSIGRPAMMGFVLLLGTYLLSGQLIPGVI